MSLAARDALREGIKQNGTLPSQGFRQAACDKNVLRSPASAPSPAANRWGSSRDVGLPPLTHKRFIGSVWRPFASSARSVRTRRVVRLCRQDINGRDDVIIGGSVKGTLTALRSCWWMNTLFSQLPLSVVSDGQQEKRNTDNGRVQAEACI